MGYRERGYPCARGCRRKSAVSRGGHTDRARSSPMSLAPPSARTGYRRACVAAWKKNFSPTPRGDLARGKGKSRHGCIYYWQLTFDERDNASSATIGALSPSLPTVNIIVAILYVRVG